jgi:hypothetical protein
MPYLFASSEQRQPITRTDDALGPIYTDDQGNFRCCQLYQTLNKSEENRVCGYMYHVPESMVSDKVSFFVYRDENGRLILFKEKQVERQELQFFDICYEY